MEFLNPRRRSGGCRSRTRPRRAGGAARAARQRQRRARRPAASPRARRSIGAPQFSIRRMEVDDVSVSYGDAKPRSNRSRCRSARARCWR